MKLRCIPAKRNIMLTSASVQARRPASKTDQFGMKRHSRHRDIEDISQEAETRLRTAKMTTTE
jgi:ribosomal protein S10